MSLILIHLEMKDEMRDLKTKFAEAQKREGKMMEIMQELQATVTTSGNICTLVWFGRAKGTPM